MYYGLSRCWGPVTSFKGVVDYAGNSHAGDFFKLSGSQILWGHDRHNSFWNSWANKDIKTCFQECSGLSVSMVTSLVAM